MQLKVVDRPWVVTVGVGSSRATTWLTPVGDGVTKKLLTLMHKVSTSVRVGYYWQTQFSVTWLPLHHIQLE